MLINNIQMSTIQYYHLSTHFLQYGQFDQKFIDTWPSHPYLGIPQTVATNLEARDFLECLVIKISLYWI